MVELTRKAVVSGSRRSGIRRRRENYASAGELWLLSGEVDAADAVACAAACPPMVREPETTTTATPATQNSVPGVPATQSPSPDALMDTSETATEPGRDLDVRMAERQPKRRRELEDVEMTAVLAQPASEGTYEVCGLLVHADIADDNCTEEGLTDENMRDEIENVIAGGFAAI